MDKQSGEPKLPLSRRKFLSSFGKTLAGLTAIALEACVPRQPDTYEVKILVTQSHSHYEPATLVVSKGDTVVWQNQAIYPETVTCDPSKAQGFSYVKLPAGAQPWDSGTLYPGQKWAYTFQVPGDYLYFSSSTKEPYLTGVIQVKA